MALILVPTGRPASAQCLEYSVQLIDSPCSFGYAIGQDVGAAGAMVGRFSCGITPGEFPFLFDGQTFLPLPMPMEYPKGRALRVNSANQAVGFMDNGGGHHAFLYDGTQVINLGTLPGDVESEALGISNADPPLIAGHSLGFDSKVAVVWIDGKIEALELPLGPSSMAYDASDPGTVCGWMGRNSNSSRAYIWSEGGAATLPQPADALGSQALALNNVGDACGIYKLPHQPGGYPTFAVFWPEGKMIELGVLPGNIKSFALDVNDDRMVVGRCENKGIETGFVWKDGVMMNLNDLTSLAPGFWISQARGINNDGLIAGQVDHNNGTFAALLTPIPPTPGDANCDKLVNIDDLLAVINGWGVCLRLTPCPGDLNDNDSVDVDDLLLVINNWSNA